MSVPNHFDTVQQVFNAGTWDLESTTGCGLFTEAVVRALRQRDARWHHLKKNPGQNNYDGHAVDNGLYVVDAPALSIAVDFVRGSAEAGATIAWTPDDPRYTAADAMVPEPLQTSGIVRPPLPFIRGWTGFDWGTHRDPAWLALQQQYGARVTRLVPQSVFRDRPRTLAQGLVQLDLALSALTGTDMKVLVVLNCDTREYTRTEGLTEAGIIANTIEANRICVKHLSVIAAATLFNENRNTNELPIASSSKFLKTLDGYVDARIPLAWGHIWGWEGEALSAGGSFIAHHSDRGRTADVNGQYMASLQQRFGRKVLDQEPMKIAEPGTTGQVTFNPEVAREQGAACLKYGLGGSVLHTQAGLRADVGSFGPTHRAAALAHAQALGGIIHPPPPPPPTGDPILDADMRIDAVWYPIFVLRSGDLRAAIAQEYTRLHGHVPAETDIQHNLWRACVERDRWRTMRRAMSGDPA